MRTEKIGTTLLVTDLPTLTSDNSRAFKDFVRGALGPEHTLVEVDLGAARSVDSNGLGALISVHKTLCGRGDQNRGGRLVCAAVAGGRGGIEGGGQLG